MGCMKRRDGEYADRRMLKKVEEQRGSMDVVKEDTEVVRVTEKEDRVRWK